mmetsp:Transcript_4800/g.12660  ORF Transcript_4800/g.12660 Transcript_4800/m.12660 type:complete len:205 (-) Transcript_4800:1607-2221(-)
MRRNRTPARPVGWRPPLAIHLHVRSCMRARWRTHIRWTGALSDSRRAPPLMQRKCTPCVCVVRRLTSPPSCPSTFAPTGVGLAPMPTPAYPTATAKAPAILRRPQRPWPLFLREHARFAVRPCAVKIIGQAEALETVATSVVEVRDAVGPGVLGAARAVAFAAVGHRIAEHFLLSEWRRAPRVASRGEDTIVDAAHLHCRRTEV